MIITLCAPRFDVLASIVLDVDAFDMGEERIHSTSNALAGDVILQDVGTRIVASVSIVIRTGSRALYDDLQAIIANHPTLEMSHPDGRFTIAPTSAKTSNATIIIAALVVGRV